jgi:hypothetical protein
MNQYELQMNQYELQMNQYDFEFESAPVALAYYGFHLTVIL